MKSTISISIAALVIMTMVFTSAPVKADALIADHTAAANFENIPESYIDQIKSDCKIFYGRLSHGDQVTLGMGMLMDEDSTYSINNGAGTLDIETYDEGIYNHNTELWMGITRNRLNQPGCDINIVMWSWCTDVSISDSSDIAAYLANITQLETEYPNVHFVYMTGHVDGTGPSGNLNIRNNQIRDYVTANDKYLYDFADVESWDPDGVFYPDADEACTWCGYWCIDHPGECPTCDVCWHTDCFNCYLKGKAFWGFLALYLGWSPTQDIDDHSALPSENSISQNHPNPFNGSTIIQYSLNSDSDVNIEVFDLLGRKLETLVEDNENSGDHQVKWDASDYSTGIYFYRIETGNRSEIGKMILLK